MNIDKLYKVALGLAFACVPAIIIIVALGYSSITGFLFISFFALLALGVRGTNTFFKSFAFSLWIFASVSFAMFYPQYLTEWGGYRLSNLIVPLIKLIMFGMGTQLSLQDFAGVMKSREGYWWGCSVSSQSCRWVGSA